MLDNTVPANNRLRALVAEVRTMQKRIAAKEADIKLDKDNLLKVQRDLLPSVMHELGIESVTLDDGTRLQLKEDLTVSIPREQQFAAYKWLRANGHGGIVRRDLLVADHVDELAALADETGATYSVKESVHAATLKAWAKEMLANQESLPDDYFNFSAFTWAKITTPEMN